MDSPPAYRFVRSSELERAPELDWPHRAGCALLSQPLDEAITTVLRITGEVSGSDRSWMFEYDDSLTTFRNTHEWCRQGVPGFVHDLQDTPATMFAWLHRQLVAGRAVMVNRVEGLPRTARTLQAEMLRQADKSILAVPIVYRGDLRAAFGFDATQRYHYWPDEQIKALFRCADLIALARYGGMSWTKRQQDTNSRHPPLIYLRGSKGIRGVELSTIVCVRSARNHTTIQLTDGSYHVDQRPLGIWSGLLSPASFVRIHRTVIVNLLHVRGVRRERQGTWLLEVRHLPERLPVSRSCRSELKARLGI